MSDTTARQGNGARVRALAAQALSELTIASRSPVELSVAECLPVFSVAVGRARAAAPESWFDALDWQGQWHCQISDGTGPAGSARVVETGQEELLKVLSWSRDGLAVAVHESLVQADARLAGDAFDVGLVEIPPLGLTALLYLPRAPETRSFLSLLQSPSDTRRTRAGTLIAIDDALAEIASLPFVRGGDIDADQEPAPGFQPD